VSIGVHRLPEGTKSYYATYIGGHVEYPKSRGCQITLYDNRIELNFEKTSFFGNTFEKNPTIVISYQSMTNIENANEDRLSALRVTMLGIIGGLWKKKHVYTVIQYKDEIGEKTIALDFGNKIDQVQPLIYHKMLDSRK
jgi:hypothetical protein